MKTVRIILHGGRVQGRTLARQRDASSSKPVMARVMQQGANTYYYWAEGAVSKVGPFSSAEKARTAAKQAGFTTDAGQATARMRPMLVIEQGGKPVYNSLGVAPKTDKPPAKTGDEETVEKYKGYQIYKHGPKSKPLYGVNSKNGRALVAGLSSVEAARREIDAGESKGWD